ncbi:site-specific integrase [Mesorhizobium sp. 131-2-1]|uniref:site-specific integrase n=1 Tax=Mesorhizobium sp. 131-2-1 TaxID=2744518 RepID=UPI00192571E5|nr:tyrosine-type recombinase/integrase [Mesorhizobium sp. 131-2-1]BCG92592.1 tyrosine recombinase [Mesorhizobium sp. 131-2-1]
MKRRLPKYVSEFRDRHGKMRVRFRRKGQPEYYLKAVPWTPAFMQEYQACLQQTAAPAVVGSSLVAAGTMSALIVAFYGSADFKKLAPSTRKQYRHVIERFRNKHGDKRVAAIERKHLKAIIGTMHGTPAAADNLLDRIKQLMGFAVDIGMRKDNPALGMKGFNKHTDGWHTWTEAEIEQFEERHPIGTKARLALTLLLYTTQRRSDVVGMGWQHVTQDGIAVGQQKTHARLTIPIHPTLANVLDKTPREHLTFLVTAKGNSFTSNGFGNWFRDRCDEASLPQCSAHGLRKAASRRLAEDGKTNQQIKAITGHKTDNEVARYTAAVDQKRLARQAFGMDEEQKLSNLTQ